MTASSTSIIVMKIYVFVFLFTQLLNDTTFVSGRFLPLICRFEERRYLGSAYVLAGIYFSHNTLFMKYNNGYTQFLFSG